ncbi:MAG TPA: NUDIX hydrolase [Caulobacteraceae bacterium]|nr:NUDIX hydrolase [Caulobacteraceae bacterium]
MDEDRPDWLKPHGEGWRVTGSRPVHDNPWFAVDHYKAIAPTGAPADYYLQSYKNLAVGMLPLHEDGTVTLVGQWRFPFAAYSWEIPEGGAPTAEPPLDSARRELREEASLQAADWRHILTMQLSNSTSDELCLGYLATGLSPASEEPDATEALTVVRVPFGEALNAAVSGWIQDAITVAMLLRVHHMACEGELSDAMTRAVLGSRVRPGEVHG